MNINPDEDPMGCIGAAPTCQTCGSEHVSKDAWACWNSQSGLWELENIFDHEYCHVCEADTSFVWLRAEQVPSRRIRALNDKFRRDGATERSLIVTSGVVAQGPEFMVAAILAIQSYDAFSDNNDPWGEHDFGKVAVADQSVFWKIDYYNPDLTAGSENPGNELVTRRVLTVMLPEEY